MPFPKPKDAPKVKLSAVILYPDGREVCRKNAAGRAEYKARRAEMWSRDAGLCCLCGEFVSLGNATFEHAVGRGGGKRDDRIDGNGVSHLFGNMAKGSIAYNIYMQRSLEERRKACRGIL